MASACSLFSRWRLARSAWKGGKVERWKGGKVERWKSKIRNGKSNSNKNRNRITGIGTLMGRRTYIKTGKTGAFHLVKISGIPGSAVNGTRFVGSSHWKIPRKSGKSKKVGPFSRLEFPNGMSCSIYVSRSLYQFQVHGRAPRRAGVYDQMDKWNNFLPIPLLLPPKFPGFFPKWKAPQALG